MAELTPSEALRRARATMRHATGSSFRDDYLCELSCAGAVYEELKEAMVHLSLIDTHYPLASALLDGFSVDEITEAGG